MSYSITIAKTADGVEVTNASGLEHIPDGVFTINGHTPAPGMSRTATLSINLAVTEHGYREQLASAAASYLLPAQS